MTPTPSEPNRRRYLDLRASCQQAFTPFAPIELPDFFAGRLSVVQRLKDELEMPGRHVAIFGERGVGKTSLAELLYFFTGFAEDRVELVSCAEADTFESLFAEFMAAFSVHLSLDSVERQEALELGGNLPGVGLRGERRQSATYRSLPQLQAVTKRRLLRAFKELRTLLIIDEFDRIQDRSTHTRLAELIKAFSDARTATKIVVVGVADTLSQLVGEHQSLSRSLAQIKLDRMSEVELAEILKRGEDRTGVLFRSDVVHRIVRLSDGFPHYVHLIALYASLAAVEESLGRPSHTPRVGEAEYRRGVEGAIQNCEHTLVEAYENAVVTTKKKSDIYELILHGIAMGEGPVAQVRDIAQHASTLAGREIKPARLSTALGNLTRERGQVLTKVRDGHYKFTNPLLRGYVRLLLDRMYYGQLKLPFFD